MNQNDELEPRLAEQLAALRPVQARDPQKAAQGRAAFLAEAEEIRPAVAPVQKTHLGVWLSALAAQIFPKKKEYHMFSVISTIILVLGVLFGGSGITLAAAQTSMPDQPLYGLKLWTEQVQFSLAGEDVESQMQLSMQFARRRMEEISAMLTNGNTSDQAVLARLQYRYQAQIENTMRLAAGLPNEEEVLVALDETKDEIGIHIRKLDQDRIQGRTGVPEHAVLANIQAMLQERLQWLEAGIAEPNQLRYRLEEQLKLQAQRPVDGEEILTPTGDETETPVPSFGPGPNTDCPEGEICTPFGPNPAGSFGPGPYPSFMPTARGPQDPQFNGSGTQPGPGPQTSPSPNGKP